MLKKYYKSYKENYELHFWNLPLTSLPHHLPSHLWGWFSSQCCFGRHSWHGRLFYRPLQSTGCRPHTAPYTDSRSETSGSPVKQNKVCQHHSHQILHQLTLLGLVLVHDNRLGIRLGPYWDLRYLGDGLHLLHTPNADLRNPQGTVHMSPLCTTPT